MESTEVKAWKGFKDKPCPCLQYAVRHNQSLLKPKSHPVSGRYENFCFQLTPTYTPVTSCSEDGKCGHIHKCTRWIHICINWSLENASLEAVFLVSDMILQLTQPSAEIVFSVTALSLLLVQYIVHCYSFSFCWSFLI